MTTIVNDVSDVGIYNIVADQGTTFIRQIVYKNSAGAAVNLGNCAYLSGSGLVFPGLTGNYASTPDSAALSVTGDIDIKVKVAMADWTPSTSMALVGKVATTSTRSFFFSVATNGTLTLVTSPDGTLGGQISGTSSVATGFANGTTNWVRATLDVVNSTNRIYKFYTSSDGITWTQLGTTQTVAGATSIHDNNSSLEIGSLLSGTAQPLEGTVHRAIIQSAYDTADNTTSVVFDADFSTQTSGAYTFAESSVNAATVTINTLNGPFGAMKVRKSYPATLKVPAYRGDPVLNLTNTGSGGSTQALSFISINGVINIKIPSATMSGVPAGIYDYDLEVTLGASPGVGTSGDVIKIIRGLFEVRQEITY